MRFFLALSLLLFAVAFMPAKAEESCAHHPFHGTWENIRQETKQLSRLEIRDTCDPDSTYGRIQVRAFEKCAPRDCSWGWTGIIEIDRTMKASFTTFIARRHITVSRFSDRVRVLVETDFINPTRTDTSTAHILVRQP